ncbi:hypothetical protein D0Z08_20060 [Nocardioides immobilis]|uniref:Peptidase S55 domain-containing protein n=1 Tax=Nocardioides immobilis TaxID=2049295 RepID=A0A417XXP9_9ACTN|nr:SpoIVB peptidase S55 domain-containing protein [Nocardioides immobilis]RHW25258.1 hypothetical protein D0Z08_20060 [Nocardioides immobilis]
MSRFVGPAALALGLASLAPVLAHSTAHAADPAPDCATAFPVADLVDGQTVHGLTVSSGTTPETFTGEVLGVLEDGIAPGVDMIMMRLDSPALQDAGGIWQGMSGSPVYDDATGDLIGAVAYGLAWGTTPVAGVTPFEDMDDYLAAPPAARTVDVTRSDARAIAATGEGTVAQAEQGFRHLPVPMGISGVAPDRLDGPQARPYLTPNAVSIGRANPAAAEPETLIAGGNLAAALSLGDITAAGVGTVTSVCDGRLVGFGHPMRFAGPSSYGLAAANAIYVQEDPLGVPFKLANIGTLSGTITDDRLTGISGSLGAVPAATPYTSEVTFGGRNRVGATDVLVPEALAGTVFAGSLGNHDRVFDQIGDGSEVQTWMVEGTDPTGAPFAIEFEDRIQSSFDLSYEASFPLADLVYVLGQFPGVEITSVSSTADLSSDADSYTIRKVEQRRGARWFNVGRRAAQVAAGSTLRLRVTLASADGTTTVPVRIDVPRRLRDTRGSVSLFGGNESQLAEEVFGADTFEDALEVVDGAIRNDQVEATARIGRGARQLRTSVVTAPVDLVVNGGKFVDIVVR